MSVFSTYNIPYSLISWNWSLSIGYLYLLMFIRLQCDFLSLVADISSAKVLIFLQISLILDVFCENFNKIWQENDLSSIILSIIDLIIYLVHI